MRRAFVFVLSVLPVAALLPTGSCAAPAAAASRAGSLDAPTLAAAQSQDAPAVRAIGVLRSTDRRQSRAILQVNGGPSANYAEGDALSGKWSVERIDNDAVRISDGARHMQVPVEGGEPHPALRPAGDHAPVEQPSTSVRAAPQEPASAGKQVLQDAARRRAIHLRRTD